MQHKHAGFKCIAQCLVDSLALSVGTDDFIKTNDRVVYAALLKEIIIFNSAGFPYRAEKMCSAEPAVPIL